MAFSGIYSHARHHVGITGETREERRERQERRWRECWCCFDNVQTGVQVASLLFIMLWIVLIIPGIYHLYGPPIDLYFLLYILFCLFNISVFVCVLTAFMKSSSHRPSRRYLLLPAMVTCLTVFFILPVCVVGVGTHLILGQTLMDYVFHPTMTFSALVGVCLIMSLPYVVVYCGLKRTYIKIKQESEQYSNSDEGAAHL